MSKRKGSDGFDERTAVKVEKINTEEDAGYVSRTGRVRKKSSKLLEMEESKEDIQHAIHGKAAAKKKKADESAAPEALSPPTSPVTKKGKSSGVKPDLETTSPKGNKDMIAVTTKTPLVEPLEVIEAQIKEEPVAAKRSSRGYRSKKQTADSEEKDSPHESLKLKLHLGSTPSVEKVQKELSNQPIKKVKTEKILAETSVIFPASVKMEVEKETAKVAKLPPGVKEKVKISFEDALASAPLLVAAPKPVKKKKKETKKGNLQESDDSSSSAAKSEPVKTTPTLVIEASVAEPLSVKSEPFDSVSDQPQKPKKSKCVGEEHDMETLEHENEVTKDTKPKKKKKKIREDAQQPPKKMEPEPLNYRIVPKMSDNEEDSNSDVLQIVVKTSKTALDIHKQKQLKKKQLKKNAKKEAKMAAYLDTDEKAMQLMTSAEKRKKSGKLKKKEKKRRRRLGPTAYMLFCNLYRPKVLAENRDRDFSAISRRLGEIWQGLPEKEKLVYKRKAKRLAAKAAKAMSNPAPPPASTSGNVAVVTTNSSGGRVIVHQNPSSTKKAAKKVIVTNSGPQFKPPDTQPIDVAAHLKLLGESLNIIGTKLTEHRGQIAVQGSISVLLDSFVGALGPLTALTTQVPELNSITDFTLASTLDNIAYFMPGL